MNNSKRGTVRLRLLACAAFGAVAAAAMPGIAHAQGSDAALTAQHDFNLPAQPLSRSITQVASIAGLQVLYSDDMAADIQAPAIRGRMSAQDALARLLAGSGYSMRYTSDKVVTLVKVPGGNVESGELVTGVVSVEGYQGSPYFGGAGRALGVNGVNGSRDIAATEGTGSYTSGALSVATKAPQSIKDTPQSVSVLTAESLKDQNLTDLNSAMEKFTGLSSIQGGTSVQKRYYSRGFEITSFQIDGGAPFITQSPVTDGSPPATGYFPLVDLAQYDRVELLRGAAGLYNGYGTPGGTINLARKRPLDHGQVLAEGKVGSWGNYRAMIDVASPIGFDGKLRGRLVATYQENDFFYDRARDKKTLLYGVAEYDLTPTTLLTAGFSLANQDSVPSGQGLPRYFNGDDLGLPRSTCLCLDWGRFDVETRELFAKFDQDIGDDWHANINFARLQQHTTAKYVQLVDFAWVSPDGTSGATFAGTYNDYSTRQTSVDGTITGIINALGNDQLITMGANYSVSDGVPQNSYAALFSPRPSVNPLTFDPLDPRYREPGASLVRSRDITKIEQYGLYLNARLTFFDRLHLETGVRYSYFASDYDFQRICTNTVGICTGLQIGDLWPAEFQIIKRYSEGNFSWPPKIALSYDVGKSTTLYGSYASIYVDQSTLLDKNKNPLGPARGGTFEGGLKTERFDGKLNASLAVYYTEQTNFSERDSSVTLPDIPAGTQCCYFPSGSFARTSKGAEFEITGAVTNNLKISLGYSYTDSTIKSTLPSDDGQPFETREPKHTFRMWSEYEFAESSRLKGLAISLGVQAKSDTFVNGEVCTRIDPNNTLECISYDPPDYVMVPFIEPGWIVFNGALSYQLTDNIEAIVNVDNILDKTYYSTVGNISGGNWYGAPRSFTATLRGKW